MDRIESYKRKAEFLYRWIRLGQNDITVEKLLLERGYNRIALYGFNEISRAIVYELDDSSEVCVECIIDQRGDRINMDIPAYTLEEAPKGLNVDAIVIALTDMELVESLKRIMNNTFSFDVIDMSELLYEL